MPIVVEWPGGSHMVRETETALVGRHSAADIRIDHSKVSRHHLLILWESGKWIARDLESANGSYSNEEKFSEIHLSRSNEIQLGGLLGPNITVTVLSQLGPSTKESELIVQNVKGSEDSPTPRVQLGERCRLGSDASNEICIPSDEVSRFHAEISTVDGRNHQIFDLKSVSGTFVNGKLVKRKALLVGDVISIGPKSLRYTGGALEQLDANSGPTLSVRGVGLSISGKKLVSNVSFDLMPSSLTAILGPSGAGKSTLLDILTGKRAPSHGEVLFGNRNLHANFDEFRSKLGYVPQTDLLHTNLTVKNALRFGADLRFPKGVSSERKAERVDKVISDLGLSERAELRIDKLSGGQRKRTSVALELLTEPLLLFLDEPTSGLDPGLDRQVMNLLRKLASEGRTVVVVTHSTANLDLCDDVLVLSPGGKVAYFGSPLTVLSGLASKDWAQAFEKVESGQVKEQDPRSSSDGATNANVSAKISSRQSWFFQLWTLIRRYLAVIRADAPYLFFLATLPILLASVGFVVGNDSGLAEGSSSSLFLNPQAQSLMLIIILGAAFMGMAASIQELVKERPIFEREKNTGLSTTAYIASKILVLGVLVVIQSALFTGLSLFDRPLPETGLIFRDSLIEILIVVSSLAFASMLMGLIFSSISRTIETSMPALVILTMTQVIFSGAVPLRIEGLIESIGPGIPAYWTMNALSSTVDLNTLLGNESGSVVNEWSSSEQTWMDAASSIAIFSVILSLALILITQRFRLGKR
jgi:ABC-type multidrug transport system ATPase subunit/pSer/pThr/pTyr-binding forkhead associated (FHA) protein